MSMTMTAGRVAERNLTDEELARPAVVANLLSKSRTDLGTGVKVDGVEPVHGRLAQPPLTPAERQEVQDAGITPRSALTAIAQSKLAESQGQTFKRDYIKLGFMLAKADHKPERNEEQLAQMRAASPAELNDVIVESTRRRESLVQRETVMRLDQYIKNDPAVAARAADVSGGKTLEGNRAALMKEFGHMNFDVQRDVSKRDGKEIGNSPEDRKAIAALGRGYHAIAAQLTSLGLPVPVNMQGKSMVRAAKGNAEVGRVESAPQRRTRDGVVIGGGMGM